MMFNFISIVVSVDRVFFVLLTPLIKGFLLRTNSSKPKGNSVRYFSMFSFGRVDPGKYIYSPEDCRSEGMKA